MSPVTEHTIVRGEHAQNPPSTLKQKLKRSKKELKSRWAFAFFSFWCVVKSSLNGNVFMVATLVLTMAFPLSMLAIGIIYLYDCPAEVYIPIFTLGWGLIAAIKIFLSLRVQYIVVRSRKQDQPQGRGTLTRFSSLFRDIETRELNHILSAAVFAASVGLGYMTYKTYGKWTPQKEDPNYCNPNFYSFAFCTTTVILGLEFIVAFLIYPFTGAIVYSYLTVYDDISDILPARDPTEYV
ncbi:transmembrane protein 272-like [Liolophura sinensis]|uniref:transmembrane protein 272-like n=1 Tax=Liolophura sinensis TaxID=3198878 RepID=UPI0031584B19